ncbi:ABC transporter related [Parvibaculum lavamentivorans DS-1]|uniref:ABC transporter related n=2 Tax=Parvibaculum lavamentivorans TaxID=256618 RepID=A7HRA8_PARL1|nr:ABC transporter related [Parvibaculum lavamentivorans DS-1]
MSLINAGRLLEAFMPLFLKMGIDRIAVGDMRLAVPALAILGLMVLRYIAFNLGRRYVREVGVDAAFDLRQRLYWHLELQGPRFFSRYTTGDLMARAINDIMLIRQLIGMGTRLLFVLGFSGIIAFIFMFYQSPSLTLLLLPALPVFAVIGWVIAKKIFTQSTQVQEGFSSLSAQVQENLNGIRTIQTHAQEARETDRFAASSDHYAKNYYKLMSLNSGLTSAMLMATGFTTLIVVGYGGLQVVEGVITLGTFTAFIFYLNMMLAPIKEGGVMVTLFQRGGSAAARIFEILDHEPEIRDAPDAAPLDEIGGAITLNHLSYVHPAANGEGWPALNDVSLEIRKGEMIALLGRVGSGKSTLLRLIVRLLDPPPGTVYLDGRDIRMLPVSQVRSEVAMVPQDPFLFATHIAQNISYDNPDRATEEVWRAAESADLEATIRRFPHRLETMVGERGVTLSGGQKQRASLARGLVRETPVLLLDDCFSSVDTETEEFILSRLKTLRQGRTTLMVSHRVSTARHADRIIVLDEGRVAEIGTHHELIAKGGLYATLERQQGRRDELVQTLTETTGGEA